MTSYFNEFEINLKKMNFNKNDDEYIFNINYAYIISCMERYLCTAMWDTLDKYPQFYNNLGKSINSSVKVSTIFEKGFQNFFKDELKNFQFHNISQVKIYYKSAFNIIFPNDLSKIFKYVAIRHDIVHRCGFSKNEKKININYNDVNLLKEDITKFIEELDKQFIVINK